MSIIGIETITYRVQDVDQCKRFFDDFGLVLDPEQEPGIARFTLPEGSHVVLRHHDDPALPTTRMIGDGVCQITWGISDVRALETLGRGLAADRLVEQTADGAVNFMSDFGLPMALKVFDRQPVVSAPDPLNSPNRVNRLNQHRKWRLRARPSVLSHAVFAAPDYEDGFLFMRDRLGFRLTDSQRGFGKYMRPDGSLNHHCLLLMNANHRGGDGKLRFHHANFGVEDIDEVMIGANYMMRHGWEASHMGLGRHRIDSALFYYIPCPAGGEAEYGTDADMVDDSWIPRDWINPLFGVAHFVSNIPPFLMEEPEWKFQYIVDGKVPFDIERGEAV